jgi:hypothetical protein
MHGACEFYNAFEAIFNDVAGCEDLNKALLKSTGEIAYPPTFTNWISLSLLYSENRGDRTLRTLALLYHSTRPHVTSVRSRIPDLNVEDTWAL